MIRKTAPSLAHGIFYFPYKVLRLKASSYKLKTQRQGAYGGILRANEIIS